MGSKKTMQRRFEKKRKFIGNQFIKIEENSSSLPAARGGERKGLGPPATKMNAMQEKVGQKLQDQVSKGEQRKK